MKLMTYQYSDGDIDLHYDFIFVQRCPELFAKCIEDWDIVGDMIWNECYDSHGICTIQTNTQHKVETHDFIDFIEPADKTQGCSYQILYLPNNGLRVISASITYPQTPDLMPIYNSQVQEVLSLIDDNTVIVGDFHNEQDYEGLVNHAKYEQSFLKEDGSKLCLQQIITTDISKVNIGNVRCLWQEGYGHSPLEFEIN